MNNTETIITEKPLVSILINNHNYEAYLKKCIQSVLNQSYLNIEIIVYDDLSTDNSLEILKSFGDKISLIHSLPFDSKYPQLRQANAINKAFAQSKGDIICLLDSDDYFHENKIEKVVAAFDADKELCMVQHPMQTIDRDGKDIYLLRNPIFINVDIRKAIYFLKSRFQFFFIQTSGLSFRRSYLEKSLPLDTTRFEKVWADLRLTRRAMLHGKIKTLGKKLSYYRIHNLNHIHHLNDKEYFHQSLTQAHDYYNEVAKQYGFPPIHYQENMPFKIIAFLKLLYFTFICRDEWKVKKEMLAYIKTKLLTK